MGEMKTKIGKFEKYFLIKKILFTVKHMF